MRGERMEMPVIEAQRPTLVPPAPYSIPPLGFDVRASTAPAPVGRKMALLGFALGAVVGAAVMGGARASWLSQRSAQANAAIASRPAAPPPLCSPPPPAAPVAAAVPAVAAPVAVPDPDPAPAARKPAAKAKHKKAASHAPASHALGSPASDEAFMRAIQSSAK